MTKTEAESLLTRLVNAHDRDLSTARKALYVERLQAWDYEIGRRAVNHCIDADDRFPSLAKLLERCQYFAGVARTRCQTAEQEVPMTAAELQHAAEDMAREAAARRARHNGHADALCLLLERGAEIYAENAKRRAHGITPELRIPKLSEIITNMVKNAALNRSALAPTAPAPAPGRHADQTRLPDPPR